MRLRTVGKIWRISTQGFARQFGPLAEIAPCLSWIDDFFDFKTPQIDRANAVD